jgi:hypothetical protein
MGHFETVGSIRTALERNLVLRWRRIRRRTALARLWLVSSSGGGSLSPPALIICPALRVATAAQHDHVAGYDFHRGSFDALLILPVPALNSAFNENLFPFAQVFTAYLSQSAPRDDAMPFGTLLIVAVLVLPSLGSCNCEGCDSFAGRGVSDFRIPAQISEQKHLVQRSLGHTCLHSDDFSVERENYCRRCDGKVSSPKMPGVVKAKGRKWKTIHMSGTLSISRRGAKK